MTASTIFKEFNLISFSYDNFPLTANPMAQISLPFISLKDYQGIICQAYTTEELTLPAVLSCVRYGARPQRELKLSVALGGMVADFV